MSEWITAAGTPQASTSNLAQEDQRGKPQHVVGGMGFETRSNGDGSASIVTTQGASYTAGQDEGSSGSVLATAKTEGGSVIVNRAVKGSDQVMLPEGIPTAAEVAAQLGYLVRNPDGTFSDAQRPKALKDPAQEALKGTPQGDAEEAPEADTSEGGFHIGDEGEAAMTALIDSVMPSDLIRASDEIIQLGEVSENTLSRMASMAQVEPDQMLEQIIAAHQGFYDSAMDHMANLGVTNDDAFEAFLAANPHEAQKMPEVARALFLNNDTSGLDDLAASFLEQADKYNTAEVKDALREAGYAFQDGSNGRLLVNIDGAMVSWHVAVRQKLIRFI
ncbi:hypothetical protein [Shimia sp. SDUM112013]|uniref:hypothetical protein n=1 Tax=Shimia sp. SDUM112013 TaxID=3136160 RepID=UPI0032EAFD83